MKYSCALALVATAVTGLSLPQLQQTAFHDQAPFLQEKFLIELAPGDTRWVTEDEKWELKRRGHTFMDITTTRQSYPLVSLAGQSGSEVTFPSHPNHNSSVKALAKSLSTKYMRDHLEIFTAFYTRYYKSSTGVASAKWLYDQVNSTVASSGADQYGTTVRLFDHEWGQPSIIARIPGQSNKTIVIGAHQDSINLLFPAMFPAPGADDDGSGTVTILEAMRVLLTSQQIVQGQATNTIEFHWYSAEEGGLLGSQAVFEEYSRQGRDIKAMFQQDMTGYVTKTLEAGQPESVGVIIDFVDLGLTEFIKRLITTYCDIPYVLTKCGYACSDHASASKYGYPSAFVIESDFQYSDSMIHTTEDKIEYLSFDHMLQHAKLTLGFAFEAGMAEF